MQLEQRAYAIAWTAMAWPIVWINAAYLISADAGFVPWCFPYLEGCASISRAARHGVANGLFKATMLPYAALLMTFWWLAARWLARWAPGRARARLAMWGFGWIGAAFLVLYTVFLGEEGAGAQFMRRYGGAVYFSFTGFAQIVLMAAVVNDARLPARLRRGLLALCLGLLLMGLGSIPFQHLVQDRYALVSAIEWSYALLMALFFAVAGAAWRAAGFPRNAATPA